MSFDTLPLIIVTAKSRSVAAGLISEIIDLDVTTDVKPADDESKDRVWRIHNKYYSALVRLHARAEHDAPRALRAAPHALVVHLAGSEDARTAARRVDAAAWTCGAERGGVTRGVNALACEAAALSRELRALCAARHLEPVALRSPPPSGPFEASGVEALRGALHAHAWPGLRRHAAAPAAAEEAEEECDSGGSWGSWQEAECMDMERFARAVSALGAGARHAARLEGDARRDAAEQIVEAFARACHLPAAEL